MGLISRLTNFYKKIFEADTVTHLIISSIIRFLLIAYGVFHDEHFEVPYTDIDYKVFTDAARHVTKGESPYQRHTFRYSPLIAILLTPNIYCHSLFGKVVFCEIDLLVAYLIYQLVYLNVIEWIDKYENCTSKKAPLSGAGYKLEEKSSQKGKRRKQIPKFNVKAQTASFWAHRAMLCWLYNPMTIAISTRGNSDSLACLLVIVTLYCIQKKLPSYLVGFVHGISIHFRIYPIIYSLLFYMYYSKYAYYFQPMEQLSQTSHNNMPIKRTKKNKLVKKDNQNLSNTQHSNVLKLFRFTFWSYLLPNFDQAMLVLGTFISLMGLTSTFYYLYDYKYLYESILYHFVRVDFKHNFSMYFYLQYLTAFIKMPVWYTGNIWQPILINLPPIVLIAHFSIRYGLNKFSLNFGVLCQTIIFVIYNKVITSQYFVWIMGLLPLCLWQISISKISAVFMIAIWFLAQAAWLLPAYLLEFRGEDTFFHIWIQGISLFCAHIGIFGRIIKHFILPLGVSKKDEMSSTTNLIKHKPALSYKNK